MGFILTQDTSMRNFSESQSSFGFQWLEQDGNNLAVPVTELVFSASGAYSLSALLLSLHTGIESCKATKIAPKPTKSLCMLA